MAEPVTRAGASDAGAWGASEDPDRLADWAREEGRSLRTIVALECEPEDALADALHQAPGGARLLVMVARVLPRTVAVLERAPLARLDALELVLLRGIDGGRGQDALLACAERAGLHPASAHPVVVRGLTGVRVCLVPEPTSPGAALAGLAELARHTAPSVARERPGPRVAVLGQVGEWVQGLAHSTVVVPGWAREPIELRAASPDLLLLAPDPQAIARANAQGSLTPDEPDAALVEAVDAARAAGAATLVGEGAPAVWQQRADALVPLAPHPVDAATVQPAPSATAPLTPSLPEDPATAATDLVARSASGEALCAPALPEAVAERLAPALRALLTREPGDLGDDPFAAWRHGTRLQRAALAAYDVVAWWRDRAEQHERPSPAPATVTVLAVVDAPDEEQQVRAQLARQAHQARELVLVRRGRAAGDDPESQPQMLAAAEHDVPVTTVDLAADVPLGAALAAGTERASGDLLARLAPQSWHGAQHLGDLVAALERSGATVVARSQGFRYDPEADVTCYEPPVDGADAGITDHGLAPETLLLRRDDLAVLGGWASAEARSEEAVAAHLLDAVARWGGRAHRDHPFGRLRREPGAAAAVTAAGWSAPGLRTDVADCLP